jgi:3-isopropylmalate/(R)-2-methylmalate dehydratase small subunit
MGRLARAWKFGDDIDTDVITPGRYLVINDPQELARHIFEGIKPEFAAGVQTGDIVVAGSNFGCGSSREHAPLAIKGAKVGAVVAKSFARIFFRNAINTGLPLLICPEADRIKDGDQIKIDMDKGIVYDLSDGNAYKTTPLAGFLREIVQVGGLVEYTKRQVGRA